MRGWPYASLFAQWPPPPLRPPPCRLGAAEFTRHVEELPRDAVAPGGSPRGTSLEGPYLSSRSGWIGTPNLISGEGARGLATCSVPAVSPCTSLLSTGPPARVSSTLGPTCTSGALGVAVERPPPLTSVLALLVVGATSRSVSSTLAGRNCSVCLVAPE